MRYGNDAIEMLKKVLANNQIITSRNENSVTGEFQKRFAEMLEVDYALAVSSGTAGLHIALLSCGIKAGDEVLVDPIYRYAAYATVYCYAKPIFYDVDLDTYMPTVKNLVSCISERTKAIVVTNLFGCTPDLNEIRLLCDKHGIFLIEDCAQSLICRNNKKLSGNYGDIGVFSFHSKKHLSLGEGGMIITNNESLYRNAVYLHNLGTGQNKSIKYDVNLKLGYNYRISEFVSAVGITQLKKVDEFINFHKLVGSTLSSIINGKSIVCQKNLYSDHVYWWWACRIEDKEKFLFLEEKYKDNKLLQFGHNRKKTVADFGLYESRFNSNCSDKEVYQNSSEEKLEPLINATRIVNELLNIKINYGVSLEPYQELACKIMDDMK